MSGGARTAAVVLDRLCCAADARRLGDGQAMKATCAGVVGWHSRLKKRLRCVEGEIIIIQIRVLPEKVRTTRVTCPIAQDSGSKTRENTTNEVTIQVLERAASSDERAIEEHQAVEAVS